MDDEGAAKLIAVIHRLANRIDSLDKITVEAAAIAHEGRRAAMDAADATSPKQTAKHLATHIKPVIGKFEGEFRTSMDQMNDIVRQLLGHAQTAGDTLKPLTVTPLLLRESTNDVAEIFSSGQGRLDFPLSSSRYYPHGYSTISFCEANGVARPSAALSNGNTRMAIFGSA